MGVNVGGMGVNVGGMGVNVGGMAVNVVGIGVEATVQLDEAINSASARNIDRIDVFMILYPLDFA
jgi:hypothetical protein